MNTVLKRKCIEELEQARAEKRVISVVFGIVIGIYVYMMLHSGQTGKEDFLIFSYFCILTNIYAFLPVYHQHTREIVKLETNLQELDFTENGEEK